MTTLHHGGRGEHRGNVFFLQVRTSGPPCPLWWRGCELLTKHVFDTVEEIALVLRFVARPRLELLLRERFRQLFEQLALLLRELLRRLHLHGREQIAASASVDVGHPLAAQPQRGAGLRPFGDFDRVHTIQRRHLNLAAERHGREVDRDLAEQIVAVAAEELVLLHVDDDVEMAGGTAGGSGLAFTLQTQLLSRRDARRNLDRDLALVRHATRAAAPLARVGDDLSRATALRARPRDGEEALLEADLSLAAALRALTRRRARRRAGSVTGLAVLLSRDLDRRFCAARRFLERDLEVVPQVGAALRSAAPAAAAKQIPETEDVTKTAEDVFEAGKD